MIEGGTLYPFYRPFASRSHDNVLRALEHGGASSLWTAMGIAANGFGFAQELKFCSQCLQADVERCGFSYWHRVHHLPGVRVCHVHTCYLVPAFGLERRGRFELVFPPKNAPEHIGCEPPWQRRFAQVASDLLGAAIQPLDSMRLNRTYLTALRERGYARVAAGKLRADGTAVASALRNHFGGFVGFTHKERLIRSERTPVNWAYALLRRPAVSSHPVCHLLMWMWLYGSVDKFRAAYACSEQVTLGDAQARRVSSSVPEKALKGQEQRKLWTKICLESRGVTMARDLAAATYAWLYRNDRDWLLAANSDLRTNKKSKSRVNWAARDVELRMQASIAASEMQTKTPNQRLTASRIYRALGETMVRRNAEKLPLLHQLVAALAEPRTEYHQRRILNELATFSSSNTALTWSGVQRAAGLRRWTPALCAFTLDRASKLGLNLEYQSLRVNRGLASAHRS